MMTTSKASEAPEWPSFVGSWPDLTGRQEPADESWVEGDETDGDRAAQLGQRVGVRCMPWQWWTLRKILSRNDDGLWTHPDVCTICPRQQGKTEIVVLRMLFGLFMLDEQIVYSAQRWVTAESVYRRLKAVIERRPSLQRRLAKDPTSSSSRAVIELKSGARVALGVRSGDLGRGLDNIATVIFDESYNLTEVEVASLAGSQLAAANSQTIYVSTAPVYAVHQDCHVLAGLRRLGQRRQPGLFFAEWAAPADTARDDPEAWRLAGPSHGAILKERDIQRLCAKATTPIAQALFDADYLGWGDYPPDESEVVAVIPAETWDSITNDDPQLVGPVAIAVDRSPDRKQWAIAAAQRTTDGRVHIEIGPYEASWWSNTDLVVKLVEIITEWDPIVLVIDARSAAAVLKPLLTGVEVEPVMANAADLALACGGFLDSVNARQISHAGQQQLSEAVASAVRRDLPGGGFAWDRAAGQSIAPLVAATLAHWALLAHSRPVKPLPPPPLVDRPTTRRDDDEFDRALGADRDIMRVPF